MFYNNFNYLVNIYLMNSPNELKYPLNQQKKMKHHEKENNTVIEMCTGLSQDSSLMTMMISE